MKGYFFSKENVHQAIWAIVVASIVGAAGYIIGRISGPEKIIVTNSSSKSTPLIVRVAPDDNTNNVNSNLNIIAAHLEAIKNIQLGNTIKEEQILSNKKTSKVSYNLPQAPKFKMPKNVKGYVRASLVGYGEATCPNAVIPQETVLLIQLYIEPKVRLESLTPAIIQMDKPGENNSLTHVFEQQFELFNGINTFRLPLNLDKGVYHLEAGFYLRTDLNEEFPDYHSIRCPIEVKS